MKQVLIIAGGSLLSFLLLLAVGLGLLSMKPELFGAHAGDNVAADSLAQHAESLKAEKGDSTLVAVADSQQTKGVSAPDTMLVARLIQRTKSLEAQLDALKKNNSTSPAAVASTDTLAHADWKATAKLIESMSPEEAIKILRQMSDPEIKQILAKLKKRQAGKILASLEPDRAVKILR